MQQDIHTDKMSVIKKYPTSILHSNLYTKRKINSLAYKMAEKQYAIIKIQALNAEDLSKVLSNVSFNIVYKIIFTYIHNCSVVYKKML